MGLQYAFGRSGPLSMAPSQLGILAKSDPAVATADLEYHVQPLNTDKLGEPLHRYPAVTVSVCNLRPESRGTVHVTARDATLAPEIRPNYLSTAGDRLLAAKSIRHARSLMQAKAIAKFRPQEMLPGLEYESDDHLPPVGTCKMGDDPMAVVDTKLRVHGLDRLRVVDASIMPTIVSGNTNSPVIMIAKKAAEAMLAKA